MNTDPRDIELIEKYLDNLLSREDHAAFEKRVIEDPDFRHLFELRKALPSLMVKARRLEQTREEVRRSIKTTVPVFSIPLRPAYLAWAAVVILFIGISLIYFFVIKEGRPPQNKPGDIVKGKDTLVLIPGEKPAYKANKMTVDSVSHGGVRIITPVEGHVFNMKDSILFSWSPPFDTEKDLVVLFSIDQNIAFRTAIKPGQKKFTLQPWKLSPGKYEWYIGSSNNLRAFTVKNNIK